MFMNEPLFLSLIWATLAICFISLISYSWKSRWLYYYGYKLPGPFSVPFIGSLQVTKIKPQEMYKWLKSLFETYPGAFKFWGGPDLFVSTTNLDDLKTIMTTFLDKGDFYSLADEYFRGTLASAPVEVWKRHRKIVAPNFNTKLIDSFFDMFVKRADILCETLGKSCGESTDVFFKIWRCTFDATFDTLAEVDADLIKDQDAYLKAAARVEEILLQRFFHPLWHFNIFWKWSWLKKEVQNTWNRTNLLVEQIIRLNRQFVKHEESLKKKGFLNTLLNSDSSDYSHEYVLNETSFFFFVGSETSGVALSSCLILLAINPEIQKNIDDELDSIFEGNNRTLTLDDVNRMDYIERVIKESLRLLPPIPIVLRSLDRNLKLESCVLPAKSNVVIPIVFIQRHPEFWPDPLKFNPDRFLPEEVENRHPLAFIPFSYGVRNCIGNKYAMLSMKVILSTILRRFRVKPSKYKTVEEIEFLIHIIAKLKNGFEVILEPKQ